MYRSQFFFSDHCIKQIVTHSPLFLPYFDVICDLLLERRTASWNLFLGATVIEKVLDDEAVVLSQCRLSVGDSLSLCFWYYRLQVSFSNQLTDD